MTESFQNNSLFNSIARKHIPRCFMMRVLLVALAAASAASATNDTVKIDWSVQCDGRVSAGLRPYTVYEWA